MKLLVTGAAGFVGSFVVARLLDRGDEVVALDSFDATVYPAQLKRDRAERLLGRPGFRLVELALDGAAALARLIDETRPEVVVHLGALANPRLSVRQPALYIQTNIAGTLNLLEAMRLAGTGKLVLASSSTVYGSDQSHPWREELPCDRPLNPYAASKRAAELLCHSYHATAGIDVFALRFFTAYGPWGRPDMMPFVVTRSLLEGTSFTLFDEGRPRRDFTFVEDVAAGVVAAADRVAGFEVLNLGRGEPVAMIDFVRTLEEITGQTARYETAPMPPSDAPITYADISKARRLLDYDPRVSLRDGLERLVAWYRSYYGAPIEAR